jgi:hypothetical protein
MRYRCDGQWSLYEENGVDEIKIYSFSTKITTDIVDGYSFFTIYVSVIISLSTLIHTILIPQTNTAFITEITHPDPVLKLCECIHLMRNEN